MQQLGPHSIGQVFEYLKQAQSPQTEVRKAAEAALKALESQPGFCSCLAEIIKNKQAEHSARWLAVICFKNTITRYWKSRAGQGGFVDEEKAHLRQTLVQLIDQENAQMAVPIAVAFAKVARADYPRQWPTLFQDLMSRLTSQDMLTVRRVYLVLHHIIKELASMRLPGDKRNFVEVTSMLYEPYWNQWCGDTQTLMNGLGDALTTAQQPTPLVVVFERWFLELKGLRRMVLFSTQSDAKSLQAAPAVSQIVPAVLQALQAFHAMRPTSTGMRAQLHAMLDRALVKLAKTLNDVLNVHPWSFYHSGCFQQCLEYFAGLLVAQPQSSPAYERFLMQAMIFLHDVLTCKAYRGVPEVIQAGSAGEVQAQQIKQMGVGVQKELVGFWQSGHAQTLCRALLHLYFPLTAKELQEWAESPEEFHQQAGAGVWQESLRACAETLFTTLLGANRDTLAPAVLDSLRETGNACPSGRSSAVPGPFREGIPEAVLAKEAAYNAMGVAAWELLDHVDFTLWLHEALLPTLADTSPENKPLRRRTAILIGQWVSKLKAQDRPTVYRALLGLVADDDFAISLAGSAALMDLINDWDFQEEPFMEFVAPCLQLLAGQLHAASQYDTQLQVFNLVNLIFDRLADSVKPFTGTILQLLPDLWRKAEEQSLLRIQILLAIQRVVNALGLHSPTTYPLLLPILQYCTDPTQKDALNLLEDGLHLWLLALRNAPSPHPHLLGLFPNLVTAMERSTEHVQVATQIMTSCALLGGRNFLAAHGQHVVAILTELIGHLTEKGMLLLMPVMDTVLQTVPTEGPALLQPALRALLSAIHSGKESAIVVSSAVGIFARVLLQSSDFFVAFFQSAQGPPGCSALEAFVGLWMEKFDSISSPGGRKLSALALCQLLHLQSPAPWLLQQLTDIIAHITSTWYEIEDSENGSEAFVYNLFHSRLFEVGGDTSSSAAVNSEEAEGEYTRRSALEEKDPVNLLKLSDFLREKLGQAAAAPGSEAFKHTLDSFDPALAAQLRAALQQQSP